MVITLTSLNQS